MCVNNVYVLVLLSDLVDRLYLVNRDLLVDLVYMLYMLDLVNRAGLNK